VLLGLEISILPCDASKVLRLIHLRLVWCATPGWSQKAQLESGGLPRYDLHTETKTKAVVEKANLFPVGNRRDFTELIIKRGDDNVHIQECLKPLQEEMDISFGDRDEIAVTGSRIKQEAWDVMLARELVQRTDTLIFHDEGKPGRGLAHRQVSGCLGA
jgi:hypothetical protein